MKLNITVDVNDLFLSAQEDAYESGLNEDGGQQFQLTKAIEERIIDAVTSKISYDCMELVKSKSTKAIDEAIENSIKASQLAIEKKAIQFADDWLEKEVTLKDKWGDDQECLTITELIKRSFDNLMEKKVDKSGAFGGYNANTPLYKYLTENRVEDVVNAKLKDLNNDIDTAIANLVNAGIRKNVSDKFAEMVVQTAKHENKMLEQSK